MIVFHQNAEQDFFMFLIWFYGGNHQKFNLQIHNRMSIEKQQQQNSNADNHIPQSFVTVNTIRC